MTRQGPRTLPSPGHNRQVKHPSCIFHTNEANDSLGANPRPINMHRPSEIALWAPSPKTTSLRADDIRSRTGVRPTNLMTPEEKKAVRDLQNLMYPKAIERTPMVPKQTPRLPMQTPKLPEPTTKLLEPTAKSNPPKLTPKETSDSTGSTQIYRPSRAIEGVSSAEAKRNAITARRNKYKYQRDDVNHSPDIGNPESRPSVNHWRPTSRAQHLSTTIPSAQTPNVAERM
jgi:hypothetical protein